jgi:hypothetical protein
VDEIASKTTAKVMSVLSAVGATFFSEFQVAELQISDRHFAEF